MQEKIIKSDIDAWYRAHTLTERVSSLRISTQRSPSLCQELAEQKLQRWKEQKPFDKEGYFARRLAMDALTEEDLLYLLGESTEAQQARMPSKSPWMSKLTQLFEQHYEDEAVLPPQMNSEMAPARIFEIVKPLLKASLLHLRTGMQELSKQYQALPFEAETAFDMLLVHAGRRFLPKMVKTMVLELNVARMQDRLQGETPEQRFQYFLDYLSREGFRPLLEEYPVLARLLLETAESWAERSLELLERLCADWAAIRSTFLSPDEGDPGKLIDIQAGQGDSHRSGNSVTILTWSSGFRLVYKPRSLAIDAHFQDLLAWLNEQGYQPAFRTFKLLDKETYGWTEFIQAVPCTEAQQVERFYQRQGGYLAVLYALEAADFHAENLIAEGEYPVLIDLEALFHPRVTVLNAMIQGYPGLDTINHSVLRIGLLPQRLWSNEEAEGVDLSGLGYQAGQLTPMPVSTWAQADTDQMHISRERIKLAETNHRPQLNGLDVDPMTYCDSIVTGFTAAYRLLLHHRQTLLDDLIPRCATAEIRCMLRPTQIYNMFLSDSFHPDVLRDALDRDRLLDRLWIGSDQQPHLERIISAECADLRMGDIPVFTSYPDSRDLYTSSGQVIADFFEETGLEAARKGLAQFHEQDLEKQVWIIRASFTSTVLGVDKTYQRMLNLHPSDRQVSRESLIMAARDVGDRLSTLALHGEETVGWLGVTPVNEREWHLLPADLDLYSGSSGISLFLGYLGHLTDESKYTELARQALNSARKQVQLQRERGGLGIGAFNGAGSYIYLLSHLGTLWNDPELYNEAIELVEALPEIIAKDEMFDVVSGAAGCISALLSLYAVSPSISTLIAALQCGDHLLAHAKACPVGVGWGTKRQEEPLLGLSHGNAGVALNLLRLFSVSGEERFYQTALEAIAYERSLFSPEQGNWPDLRSAVAALLNVEKEQQPYMIAWCHGAPGLGLARLGALPFIDNAETRAEITTALRTTIAQGFGVNHSLCHGDMGNLDMLLTAAHTLHDEEYEQHVRRITAMLLTSIETQGWVTGVPQGVETPGLMTGLAGIGYELLRLAAVEQVPSVLLLNPPTRNSIE